MTSSGACYERMQVRGQAPATVVDPLRAQVQLVQHQERLVLVDGFGECSGSWSRLSFWVSLMVEPIVPHFEHEQSLILRDSLG